MQTAPVPSDFESRTNATYDALMWALSRPGLIRDLPMPGVEGLIDALIDRECAVHCGLAELSAYAERAGAAVVALSSADHVFLPEGPSTQMLRDLRQGSDLHPEEGATLVLAATLGEGQALRLTGPGVDGLVDVKIGGLPDGFWDMRRDVMRYPMGFEIFLIDGARVLGLPRSTAVEVL
jgi:alpha-D-ribose 1-methylphosphonate 5-triphosphate synthase subunit PhnH